MALWFGVLDPQGIQRPAARALNVQLLEDSDSQLAIATAASHFLHR
jgi:hypothetical protein